jgi:sugar (pentulose or hexulose) kinase
VTGAALGIDLGTSGVRAVLVDEAGEAVVSASAPLSAAARGECALLWAAVATALDGLAGRLGDVRAIAVDGTSGTLLPADATGAPMGRLSLYSAAASADAVAAVARAMPRESAAGGATSPLARALDLQRAGAVRVLHEADWIAGQLCGRFDLADANNALKTGFDPRGTGWPDWIAATGLRLDLLPRIVPPGTPVAAVTPAIVARFGLPEGAVVMAGTTDGCASVLATGAEGVGDGVTALGSTLVLKLVSDQPVFAPEVGVYSHLLLGRWLAGGASNAGGRALARFFAPAQLAALSERIDTARPSGLDYYPLPTMGERFPVNDPALAPRVTPRPDDDVRFLHGLLEGLAAIEARGYALLRKLGGPPVRRVLSTGGGAGNPAWTALRARALGVPVIAVPERPAAHGAALLALRGLQS